MDIGWIKYFDVLPGFMCAALASLVLELCESMSVLCCATAAVCTELRVSGMAKVQWGCLKCVDTIGSEVIYFFLKKLL